MILPTGHEVPRWKVVGGALYQTEDDGTMHEHACSQLSRDIADDYYAVFKELQELKWMYKGLCK